MCIRDSHIIAETIKLSFADRESFYGDPNFVDVPIQQLLSDDFASKRRALINPEKAFPVMPPAGELDGYGFTPFPATANAAASFSAPDTSYTCAID